MWYQILGLREYAVPSTLLLHVELPTMNSGSQVVVMHELCRCMAVSGRPRKPVPEPIQVKEHGQFVGHLHVVQPHSPTVTSQFQY